MSDRRAPDAHLTLPSESDPAWLIAEALPHLVWSAHPDGTCDYLNGRWYEFTGATHEEHRGYGWLDAIHPDDLHAVCSIWDEMVADAADYEAEHRIRAADGTYRWFLSLEFDAPLRNPRRPLPFHPI